MALATRCPHCQTAFRVASDQLKLRSGLVRCGTCKEIFNGIENLLHPDEDINAAVNAPAGSTASRWPPSTSARATPENSAPSSQVSESAPSASPAALATPPTAVGMRRDTRTRAEKSENTLFQELIAEVDHPAPPAPPEPEPVTPVTPVKSGYAASYAPVQMAPLLRTPGSMLAGLGGVRIGSAPIAHEPEPEHLQGDEIDPVPEQESADMAPEAEAVESARHDEAGSVSVGVSGADAQDRASLWQAATGDFDEDGTYFPGGEGSRQAESAIQAEVRTESAYPRASFGEAAHLFARDGMDVAPGAAQASMSPLPGLLRPSRIDDEHAAPMPDEMAHDPLPAAPDAVAAAIRAVPAASTRVLPVKPGGDAGIDADADANDLPDFVSQDLRRQGLQRIVRPLLYVLGVLLALLLLSQLVYAFRTSIAANFPQTRPVLDDACRVIGCSVGLPMQIDSVSIESSDFQPLPDQRDQFVLTVLLRNRSATVQAWPSIELTLNDTTDKVVARRVIGARDYLPVGATPAKGFNASSEQPIRLVFELARVTASGYRVYLFYP